ncbi:hypothetical protein GCM10010435_34360 [Winogradskya consettensis]|uniref:Uncharacterized protein n=1 Tax=Winogradskya consettensis TaxID=113560 RepID=A0A919VZ53_9ACTN|nr:hypothetical protein Aco04nite_39680 [Actinoplanes consettensis]
MALDEGLAAHGLLRRDVILDDGAQNLELAVIKTHDPSPSIGPGTRLPGVPVYVAVAMRAMIDR